MAFWVEDVHAMFLGHGAQLLQPVGVELAQLERHGEHRPCGRVVVKAFVPDGASGAVCRPGLQ
uniref:hypothetical protein n=1 Tax=uncultured Acidovorax sp. TaxID=158751 RepID=UPI000769B1EB|nr:hypothetical protein [uncultured Acidovorax sp.]